MSLAIKITDPCPCCSENSFANCCHPILLLNTPATTPLALMRSRYTAYVLGHNDYIVKTMKLKALKAHNSTYTTNHAIIWQSLTILDYTTIKPKDKNGIVEFKASYVLDNKPHTLHERSQFNKINGHWFYVSGKQK